MKWHKIYLEFVIQYSTYVNVISYIPSLQSTYQMSKYYTLTCWWCSRRSRPTNILMNIRTTVLEIFQPGGGELFKTVQYQCSVCQYTMKQSNTVTRINSQVKVQFSLVYIYYIYKTVKNFKHCAGEVGRYII